MQLVCIAGYCPHFCFKTILYLKVRKNYRSGYFSGCHNGNTLFGGLGLGLCLGSAGRVYTSKNYSIHDFCILTENIVGVGSSNYGFVHLDNWATL